MKVTPVNNMNSYPLREQNNSVTFRAKFNNRKINEEIAKKSDFVSRALTYLGQNDGEILNTLVTAVGTAIVAPIFIAGNPFSKEDKETKWYSAMRQPISAIIAMVMQLSVNNAFNKFMAQQASTNGFGALADLRAMPKANYLKRIIKLEHPEFTKEEIKAEVEVRQTLAEKKMVAKLRQEMKGKNVSIKELVDADALNDARKNISKELKEKYKSEIAGKRTKAADKFINEKITQEMLENRAMQNIEKAVTQEATIKWEIRKLAQNFTSIDEAIESVKKATDPNIKEVEKNIIERLENIKTYEKSKGITKAFESVTNLGKNFDEVLHNVKVKKLLRARTADAAKTFANANKWAGIVVSLVTLPFSCGLLNWAYPRVMEKVMPKLQPWIHRNEPDWKPEAKKVEQPVEIDVDDDDIEEVEDED